MKIKKGEAFTTCESLAGVKYEKAVGFSVNMHATTAPPSGQVRTVVTTAKSGSLDLRYAPREPKTFDKDTAF
ncbi:hypothetical protein [Tautonia plasticadhaerens]|uniref:Uncharacterized protein n=1 Tax=Tautonia plasticadhaerens TaxID=2527974 RepID=A0A518HB85_9BACT|nr:hypothetical protein [Tautonia plasticadhaerens]QDV38077.1 hypothetical protein ElP_60250 [Tautonia plasticadhaerens]